MKDKWSTDQSTDHSFPVSSWEILKSSSFNFGLFFFSRVFVRTHPDIFQNKQYMYVLELLLNEHQVFLKMKQALPRRFWKVLPVTEFVWDTNTLKIVFDAILSVLF